MIDRRTTLFDGTIAADNLRGQVNASEFRTPTRHRVATPDCNILSKPNGARERQAVFGERVDVLHIQDGWAFAKAGGYVGYIAQTALGPDTSPTHWMSNICGHAYSDPNFKAAETFWLPLRAKVEAIGETEKFIETKIGFIPKQQLRSIDLTYSTPVEVAKMFLGTPYLWGGDTPSGIDCSGLVRASLLACGIDCPGDADLQEATFVKTHKTPSAYDKNQLMFWKGHVALTLDDTRLIHANVHTMSVSVEGIKAALDRIETAGDGPMTNWVQL